MEKLRPRNIGGNENEEFDTKIEALPDIKKEIEKVELTSFDKVEGGSLATPFGEKSKYNEQDWRILRTDSFLLEHPDWKNLIEVKKQWADLAYKEYLYNVKFGANINLRNRTLDQIRFEAVERDSLGEHIIDEWFSKFGYSNNTLKKEILSEYRNTVSSYPEPENPSESFIKTESQIKREQLAIEKWFLVKEIAKALREIHEIESQHNMLKHDINVETQDMSQSRELGFQKKENAIKQEFMNIPENVRREWRDYYAKRLKEIRVEHGQIQEKSNEDLNEINKHYQEKAEEKIHHLILTIEQKKKEIEEIKIKEKLLGNPEKPTEDDRRTHKNELVDESRRRINQLILGFKVENFDELKIREEIRDLENKLNNLHKSIPYLTETGEPNKETLDAFKIKNNI